MIIGGMTYRDAIASDTAFKRIMASAHPEMARDYLYRMLGKKQQPSASPEATIIAAEPDDFDIKTNLSKGKTWSVVFAVCSERNLRHTEVLSRRRSRVLVEARHEIFYRLAVQGHTSPAIADAFGYDQSTVSHAIRKREAQS